MDPIVVRRADQEEIDLQLKAFLTSTPDGDLFDPDVLAHESTFVLAAFNRSGILAFLPVQQPLVEQRPMWLAMLQQVQELPHRLHRLAVWPWAT